jgi:hypothetical protein
MMSMKPTIPNVSTARAVAHTLTPAVASSFWDRGTMRDAYKIVYVLVATRGKVRPAHSW